MNLFTKAADLGIQTEYIDGQGHRHVTDVEALAAELPHRFLSQPVVIRAGQPAPTELGQDAVFPVTWKIVSDLKVLAEGVTKAGAIVWPADLPVGVHRLSLTDASPFTEETPLLVAPPKAFAGDFDRCWLLAVQLYSVRSARNWGIGDFTDLKGLLELAASLGADGVGLNPLHALFDDRPTDCSPYSPNSRLFLNPLYIDIEKLAGVRPDRDAIKKPRQGDLVDYATVARLKSEALRAAFLSFKTGRPGASHRDFEDFRVERGLLLSRFACFEA